MNKPTDVVIIFYMDGQVKNYISASTWNTKGLIVPTFSQQYDEAQQWPNMPDANQIIQNLHDNQSKDYKAEWITMDLPVDFLFRGVGAAAPEPIRPGTGELNTTARTT